MNIKFVRLFASSVLVSLLLIAPSAQAAEFFAPGPDDQGRVSISKPDVRNAYIAGADVSIESTVAGDLYAAGAKIIITGDVEQDLNVGGGDINLNGKVGGDVRIGGGDITITETIAGDLIIGGGSVTISSTSSIGGDLIVGAGRLVLDAPVKGAVRIGGGDVIINSEITGPVWVQADTSLTFGPKAKVASEVKYKGRKDAVINEGASVTNLQFEKIEKKSMGSVKSVVGGAIVIQLIAAIIAGLVLIKIFPKRVKWLVGGIAQNPWMNLGLGFLGMVVIPMAVFVALITFVGYYLAFILMTWFILALMLACLVASIFLGASIEKLLTKGTELKINWQSVVIGVVAIGLIKLIPIIGWVAILALMLMSFGSFLQFAKREIMTDRQE